MMQSQGVDCDFIIMWRDDGCGGTIIHQQIGEIVIGASISGCGCYLDIADGRVEVGFDHITSLI